MAAWPVKHVSILIALTPQTLCALGSLFSRRA